MFGLGRADTQHSLASVDSIPLSRVGLGSAPNRVACWDATQSHSKPGPPTFLGDSSEGLGAAQDSSQAQTEDTPQIPTQDSATAVSPGNQTPSQSIAPTYVQALHTLPYHQTLLGAADYMNILGASFAGRVFQSPREYSIFGWRLVLHPPPHPSSRNTTASEFTPQRANVTTARDPTSRSPEASESHDHLASRTNINPPPDTSAAGNAEGNRSESRARDVPARDDHRSNHLSQIRREMTLRRDALQRPTCVCTRACQCMPHADGMPNSEPDLGDTPSTRTRSPLGVDEVPSEPVIDRLTDGRFLGFSHSGSHLNTESQPASHGSDSTVDSGQSVALSQAPTLGSGSSVSLRPRRPRINTRSWSMPR